MSAVISVSKLVKHYGSHVAVDGVSFEVARGKVVGFLGPNGAGKSTTLRVLAGFLGKTSGEVSIMGHGVDTFEAKKSLGYMPEAVPLYPEMRVVEYLSFRAELKKVPRNERKSNVGEAMERANVADVATRRIGALSKGYRQRVGLADALVSKPPLLILDEPTAGLDPNQVRDVRTVIKELGKEHTVLLSTHILSEVEASCDEVIVIAKGKLVAIGTIEDIQKKRRSPALVIVARLGSAEKTSVERILGELAAKGAFGKITSTEDASEPGVVRARAAWKKGATEIEMHQATERAAAALVTAGIFLRSIHAEESSLEDVFAALTMGTRAGRDDAREDGRERTDEKTATTEDAS